MLKKLARMFAHALMVRVFSLLEVLGIPRLGEDRGPADGQGKTEKKGTP